MASPSKVLVLNLHSYENHADVQAAITAALAAEPASQSVVDIERGVMKFQGQNVDSLMIALAPAGSSQTAEVRAVAASGPILPSDGVILANSAGGAVVMTLPPAADVPNRIFTVKNVEDTGGVSIDADGGEFIDGVAVPIDIVALYDSLTVISDGTQWWVI
jgi:hypothetical protein